MAKGNRGGQRTRGKDIKTLESDFKALGNKLAQMAQFATPGRNYDRKKADEYYKVKEAYEDLRTQLNTLKRQQQITTQTNTNKTFVNSYGEATKREITTASYKRAQKNLDKRIMRLLGS